MEALPEAIQRQVREGKIAAQVVIKFLVSAVRISLEACQRMAAIFAQYHCDTREAGQLYAAWRKASPAIRQRILDSPDLFFKNAATSKSPVTSYILDPQFDWTVRSKYLWLQHEKLCERPRKFAVQLAPAVSYKASKRGLSPWATHEQAAHSEAAKGDIVVMQSAGWREQAWPSLALGDWSDTCATLHMWSQIVGKIRLVQSPWVNHSWHVTLYVTSTGLTTSPIPYGVRTFQIDFDFTNHQLAIRASDGGIAGFSLEPQSVAEFYRHLMDNMGKLDLHVDIYRKPNEVADPIRFDQDYSHRAYSQEHANRFWRILVQADRILKEFRSRFIGKCSPVHLFWGALDLAVTRFSGRSAPQHPGGIPNLPDFVTREAYSHEVSSCGFWPGGGAVPYAAFYSYAYPEPAGFSQASIKPAAAFYSADLREFILPYDSVRQSEFPDHTLLEFLQATYEAAADLSNWDRKSLERGHDPKRSIQPGVSRPS